MKNADKPINPIFDRHGLPLEDNKIFKYKANGLTKREYFAGLAMQGLLALPDKGTFASFDEAIEWMCEVSVKFADELLKQLENENI